MAYGIHHYQLSLFDARTGDEIKTGVLARVLAAGSILGTAYTASTIYGDKVKTAKTNPVTRAVWATDLGLSFWSVAASHDVILYTSDGFIGFVDGLAPGGRHSVEVNRDIFAPRNYVFAFAQNAAETDSTLDLPIGFGVEDAFIEAVTAVASSTIDVGLLSTETGGDADGFIDGASCATAGWVLPRNAVTVTAGTNTDYMGAVATTGVLLAAKLLGSDAVEKHGGYSRKVHLCNGTAKSITYTTSAHAVDGYAYVTGRQLF